MLRATDPTFTLISKEDSAVTICNVTEADTLSTTDIKKYFPAEVSGSKVQCKLFFLASMPIHALKKATFGLYKWADRKVWSFESYATDIRNIGFLIYRDPKKIDRDAYTKDISKELNEFPLWEDDANRYNNAKNADSFDGGL
jgi:hypothetical protein